MKYFAVFDTNVLVSAMLKGNSAPRSIIDLVETKEIIPLLNKQILEEYKDVLMREKFSFNKSEVAELIEMITDIAVFVDNTNPLDTVFSDLDDKIFYEIVMTKRESEDAYLITGNKKHFPNEYFIVTPREMIDIINRNK